MMVVALPDPLPDQTFGDYNVFLGGSINASL
jgi:hypothetical protein